MLEKLKRQVCEANQEIESSGLVTLTFGNVSGFDREKGLMVIKPSGVLYSDLTPESMAVVDLEGNTVEGDLCPSSDTPTHLILYKAFSEIGGITHTHSTYATMFAQSSFGIPCLGTTHADHFYGEVPVTRELTEKEVKDNYEAGTGNVIVERFAKLAPMQMPAVLVAGHGPFTWGLDTAHALENGIALEEIARTALGTHHITGSWPSIPKYLLDKHFFRKHGEDAYYGQQ